MLKHNLLTNANSMNRLNQIESWFHEHQDGEFGILPADHASLRVGDSQTASTVVYTTKPHCLSLIARIPTLAQPVAGIGRSGLPLRSDAHFLGNQSDPRASLLFLGDADPPDLLVFAWLREHVAIRWFGVSDSFLRLCGNLGNREILIKSADSEKSTVLRLPDLCPDYRELLGDYCSSALDRGSKIELEGAMMDRNQASDT